MSSCFGGGMMCGETCGAVTGALMVIGMVYGHSREGDQSQKEIMAAKTGNLKSSLERNIPPACAGSFSDMIYPNRGRWRRCWRKA